MSQDKVQKIIDMIANQAGELKDILNRARKDEHYHAAFEALRRWKTRTVRLLSEEVHPNEGKKLADKEKTSFIMGDPLRNLADEADMYVGFLRSLVEELEKHPEDVLSVPMPSDEKATIVHTPQPTSSRTVFIIHGHDELNRLRLEKLLRERWGLEPIILLSEAGKGRTLIEKFEEEAQRAAFAIALLTSDDLIEIEGTQYTQARPNVIFELGWFYGRLGRSRVCILFQRTAKIPSDLDGIIRIEFDNSIEEKVTEIERELKEAEILGS